MNLTENANQISTANLETIRDQIAEAHRACESHLQEGLEKANRVGSLLITAKQAVPHGKWSEWVESNCGFSMRTAQTYMRIHREFPKLSNTRDVALLGIKEADELLAEPKIVEEPRFIDSGLIPFPKIGQHLYGLDSENGLCLEIIPQGDGSAFHLNCFETQQDVSDEDDRGGYQNKAVRRHAVEFVIGVCWPDFDLSGCFWHHRDGEANEGCYHPYFNPIDPTPSPLTQSLMEGL